MTIPDAAIEAAAEALWYAPFDVKGSTVLWQGQDVETQDLYRTKARASLEAAMPALEQSFREVLAQEIEAADLYPDSRPRLSYEEAARIVRGGTA